MIRKQKGKRFGLERKRKKNRPGMILREPSIADPTANLKNSDRIWLNVWRWTTLDPAVVIPATVPFNSDKIYIGRTKVCISVLFLYDKCGDVFCLFAYMIYTLLTILLNCYIHPFFFSNHTSQNLFKYQIFKISLFIYYNFLNYNIYFYLYLQL